jgi:chromosome segregation ATPase
MSSPIKLNETLELRDASGATLRIFVPEDALNELLTERDRLRQQVADLQEKIQGLQKAVEQAEQQRHSAEDDRDGYLEALYLRTRKEISFTEEELKDLRENGLTPDQVLAELEKTFEG